MEEEYIPEGGIRIGDIYIPPPPAPALTMDATGPRLIITHIENEFFKSYANKQVLGPFHKSFSSIVGPNGSGKSNVIDSMLFVFGYRAQKIRSKKLSVLIHNSDDYPNVQSCKVTVHFQEILDKDEGYDEIPNTKISVSRTAYRDNSSYYEINGKRAQFKDVAKLLRAKGIDLDHNRFLILQGEVESISLMKPKALTEHDTGMLEFLEDIIGTSRFKIPIKLLNDRVAELSELRTEKLNRVKLVEKEKDELEGPMREALGYLILQNDKTKLENKDNQANIASLNKNISEQEAQKNEIENSASELTSKLKELQSKRKEIETEISEKAKEHGVTGKEIEKLTATFNKHEVEDTNLKEDLKNTHNRRKKLIQLLKLEKEKSERLTSLPQENKEKIDELEVQRQKLEAKVEDEEKNYEAAMATLKQETQEFQDEREVHTSKLVGLRQTVDKAQSELTIAQNELSVYTSAGEKEKIRLEQIQQGIEDTRQQLADKGERLKELNKIVPGKEKELHNTQKEAQKVAQEYQEVTQNLQEARSEFSEKSSANAASKSQGKVMDALMAQKKNGNIPGIIGTIGQLGGIDKKYDVAISTVGQGFLRNILVDTPETGKKCIEFLKRNNIGRGNFLALSQSKNKLANVCDRPFNGPKGAPRLYDLIKLSDNEHRYAFYHYLRDTLVANNIDEASKIAYGATRYRVVDLIGNVIETSGTMSGGGNQKFSGLMGQQAPEPQIDPKVMRKMEQNVEQLDQRYRELYNTKQKLEDDITRLNKEMRELKKEQSKLNMEVNPLEEQMRMLEGQVEAQNQRVKDTTPDKKRVAELEKVVRAAESKYDAASEKAGEVEIKVKNCDNKIKEITGTKIKSVQKKRDEAATRLDKIKKEITRLEVETRNNEREQKKCADKISALEDEKTEYEESMKKIVARRQEIEDICSKVMDDKTSKIEQQEAMSENIRQLKKNADVVSKEETELKSSRIEVDQKIEKIDGDIRQLTNMIHCCKRDLKKLKLVDVPDQEPEELVTYSQEELENMDMDAVKAQKNDIIAQLQQAKPNMAAINEYKKKEEVYMARAAELEEMTKQRDEQRKHHDDLRKQRLTDFMEGFGIITGKLKEMYQMITLGGDAELELVDSLDPFTEGIVFSVRPPKKSWKNITNLSGGEKTLSSLALVFALHYYKPTPLYVMDEIDAALDFKNVSIVANYIKERTKNAQFIIISLRSNMFELADRLVGIYKTSNCTKSVTIDPEKIAQNENEKPGGSLTSVSQPLREVDVN